MFIIWTNGIAEESLYSLWFEKHSKSQSIQFVKEKDKYFFFKLLWMSFFNQNSWNFWTSLEKFPFIFRKENL